MIGIENHLLGPLYAIPMTVQPYLTIWVNFCTKCERVSFLPSKGKNWTFFQKSKIDLYMAQIDKSLLWIESTHLEDVSKLLLWYTIFKTFSFIFWLQNENYAWFLNKNSIKIFFQVLDVTYHDKLLEICFMSRFFISDNAGSIWTM